MYGLPEAGVISNKLLKERLRMHDYVEVDHTPGLFKHLARPVWFTLSIDDFGITYIGKHTALHILTVFNMHPDKSSLKKQSVFFLSPKVSS